MDARLSEDVDLIAVGPRRETADLLTKALDGGLLCILGRPRWNPDFAGRSDVTPAVLEIGQDIAIKIQLLDGRHYSPWPVEQRALEQRYADAPEAADKRSWNHGMTAFFGVHLVLTSVSLTLGTIYGIHALRALRRRPAEIEPAYSDAATV